MKLEKKTETKTSIALQHKEMQSFNISMVLQKHYRHLFWGLVLLCKSNFFFFFRARAESNRVIKMFQNGPLILQLAYHVFHKVHLSLLFTQTGFKCFYLPACVTCPAHQMNSSAVFNAVAFECQTQHLRAPSPSHTHTQTHKQDSQHIGA